jgi:hypothetical protein
LACDNGGLTTTDLPPMPARLTVLRLTDELFSAIDHMDAEKVAALLAAGADPMAKDLDRGTPLLHAAATGFDAGVLLLAPVSDLRAAYSTGTNALMVAAQKCSDQAAAELARLSPNPEARDDTGECALWSALASRPPKFLTIDALLARDIDACFFPPGELRAEPLRPAALMAWRSDAEIGDGAAAIRVLEAILSRMEANAEQRSFIAATILLPLSEFAASLERKHGAGAHDLRLRGALALANVCEDWVLTEAAKSPGAGVALPEAIRVVQDKRALERGVAAAADATAPRAGSARL